MGQRFGNMAVIASDQFAGRLYVCACGWKGWSTWGHAARHAAGCPRAGTRPRDPLGLRGR